MPVRDLLRNIRLAKGCEPQDSQVVADNEDIQQNGNFHLHSNSNWHFHIYKSKKGRNEQKSYGFRESEAVLLVLQSCNINNCNGFFGAHVGRSFFLYFVESKHNT